MEKAILVGVQLPGARRGEIDGSLAELARLAKTAGAAPDTILVQHRSSIDPACFIGRGKADEIRALAREKNIQTVIFDDDLKPVQQKNLEEAIETKIIDRTRLILDIFARRARSGEGVLQVERAQLAYYLPRLSKKGAMLDSQTGGIGTRGPGERKLEVDQRRVRDRLTLLDREIEMIRRRRTVLRKHRMASGTPTIAIAGYTNAGKSTLLNTLAGSCTVYADDLLFATLDPTTRKVRLPGGRTVLFSDTVGFISKLPHTLIAAFRATMEEIAAADCVVHLVDVSHHDYAGQMQTVFDVLRELEADRVPMITVFNKSDLLTEGQKARLRREGCFLVSASTGAGIPELLERIESIVTPKLYPHRITVPYDEGDVLDDIYRLAVVKKLEYTDKGTRLSVESSPEHWRKIRALAAARSGDGRHDDTRK